MIAFLSGSVVDRGDSSVVVGVSGVGYEVFVTDYTFGKVASMEDVSFFIHTHVKEDVLALYGFLHKNELMMFRLLLSVSGVGPKAALGILSVTDVGTLSASISAKDVSVLTKVSGIGKRTAERIVLDLETKIGRFSSDGSGYKEESDAIDALSGMGYSVSEARDALSMVPKTVSDVGEKIRMALRVLGQKRR